MTIEVPTLMTVPEVMTVLKCGRAKAYKLIKDEEIPSATIAGRLVVRAEDLACYINQSFGDLDGDEENSKPLEDTAATGRELASETRTRQKLLT